MKKIYCLIILMALLVSTGMAQDVKRVLVMVGWDQADSLLPGVQLHVDAIKSIEGVTWEFDYLTRDNIEAFTDFASYDLAFVTENPGSGHANHWGTTGVKTLPTLSFKAWAIKASKVNWPWVDDVTSTDNWWSPEGNLPNTDAGAETLVEVVADHPVLADLGIAVGGTFSLATEVDTAYQGAIAFQTFNITDNADIVANATAVAISNVAVDSAQSAMNILYAVEENPSSKRTVVLGTHQRYLEFPTAEMNQLTTGAVKWLLDLQPAPEPCDTCTRVLVMVGWDQADSELPGVKNPVDAIKSIEGVAWEFDYLTRDNIEAFTDFASYDLAFITENPGSGHARFWGVEGVKALPTLNYKAWAIRASKESWPWVDDVNSTDNWWTPVLPNTDAVAETKVEVIADHAILGDMDIAVGGTFSLGTEVAVEHQGTITIQTYNITDDADITANATAVAISSIAVDSSKAAMNILYAIEENPSSKRHVVLGTHQRYLEHPTAEMDQLTTGAVKWLLGLGVGISNDQVADFNATIYPNPASHIATVRFNVENSSIVDIIVINALGQTVYRRADSQSAGLQYENINVSEFATGLYFVKVQMNGLQQVQKLLVK